MTQKYGLASVQMGSKQDQRKDNIIEMGDRDFGLRQVLKVHPLACGTTPDEQV